MAARSFPVAVLVTFALCWTHIGAATKWVEATSPHFTVISDAGEKQARAVAWQFEQIREALVRLWPWATVEFGRPVVVYAARDEKSMRALVPEHFEGRNAVRPTSVFQSAPHGHYVVLRTDINTRGAVDVNPKHARRSGSSSCSARATRIAPVAWRCSIQDVRAAWPMRADC